MTAPKATERSEDRSNRSAETEASNLDRRYGEIGIPAVAAAARCRPVEPQRRAAASPDRFRYDDYL
jgi:ferric-dicitrate binding protein FerR (iron transport regulator)